MRGNDSLNRRTIGNALRAVLLMAIVATGYGRAAVSRADGELAATPMAIETSVPTVIPTEEITPEPTVEAPAEPAVVATETLPATTEPEASETPTSPAGPVEVPTVNGETSAPTVEPEPGVLRFSPNGLPACTPSPGSTGEVTLGDAIDYVCEIAIEVSGERIDPAGARFDWLMRVAPGDGWQVQTLAPPDEDEATPRWTDHSGDPVELRGRTPLPAGVTVSDDATFLATGRVTVGLRLWRMGCGGGEAPARVAIETIAGLVDPASARIEQTAPQPEPFSLLPVLAPGSPPTLTFGGSLDFGEVEVDALGVRTLPEPRTLTVTVSGLDRACGDWMLDLASASLTSGDDDAQAASLRLVAIDGMAAPDDGCALDDGCAIAVIAAGPETEPSMTISLGIALDLPDGLMPATFNTTLTATLAEASPSE